LDRRLLELSSVRGYERLGHLLRGASTWDEYQEFLGQIDITLWFKRNHLLTEIEPGLPHRKGEADVLATFLGNDMYCEVTAFQSIAKSMSTMTNLEKGRVQKKLSVLQKRQPWKSKIDMEHDFDVKRAVRNLLAKTKYQLPINHIGILALDTGKSAMFKFDVKEIAENLFPRRPQVTMIILWSWEGDGDNESDEHWTKNNPTICFVNRQSKFRKLADKLLLSLELQSEVV
jgi:hypothetical protein